MDIKLFDRMCAHTAETAARLLAPVGGKAFLCALSGGADSAALLRILKKLSADMRFSLEAVHINHRLRGSASDKDEEFCASLCRDIDIPLTVRRAEGLLPGRGAETRARDARYALIKQVYAQTGADAVFLAHHAGDSAETLLLNMARGAGTRGLGAIKEYAERDGMRLIRPLLAFGRAQIEALGFEHINDESNLLADNPRNALRLYIMPELEKLFPGASERMAAAAGIAALEDDYLNEAASSYGAGGAAYIGIETLSSMHAALRRRVLRIFSGINAGYAATMALERLVFSNVGAAAALPGGFTAERGYRYLFAPDRLKPFNIDINISPRRPGEGCGDGVRAQAMPKALYDRCAVRNWLPGDIIRPFGMKGRKSMQDYFTDLKVDRPFRALIPILCEGGEVIWAPGLGASENARIAPGQDSVTVTCRGDMPWRKNN